MGKLYFPPFLSILFDDDFLFFLLDLRFFVPLLLTLLTLLLLLLLLLLRVLRRPRLPE